MRYGDLVVGSWERTDGSVGPPGVFWLETERAWNFSLYSRYATGVTLLLYSETDFDPDRFVDPCAKRLV